MNGREISVCNSGEGDIIGSYNGLEHFHEKVDLELNIEG